jgi:hypothetical protein
MALNTNPFVEGIDPSGTFGGYASVLLQLIRQAQPSSTYGMILFDTATPDVTGANAWRKRCIWVNLTTPGTPTVNVYKEGGSPGWSNVQALIPPNTITTAMIQNAAVTLAKLSTSGGTANQLIRVNGTATAFEFVSLASLVTTGSIPVGSLITTGIPAGQLRFAGVVGPGTATWYDAQQIINALSNAAIGTDLIAPAPVTSTRSKMLTTRTADTFATWRYFEPNVDILNDTMNGSKLQAGTVGPERLYSTGVPDGYLLSKVAGVPDWIPAPTANYVNKYASTATALPAAGNAITPLNHGLGGHPINVYGVLVCVTAEHGYVAGDEIPLSQIYVTFSNNESPAFAMHATTTQIHCVRNVDSDLLTLNGSTGATAGVALAAGNWNIKFYAIK